MPGLVGAALPTTRVGTWSNLVVANVTNVAAEGLYVANRIEVAYQLKTEDGLAVADQVIVGLRLSDADGGAASATSTINAANTPVGTILEGAGTSQARIQTNSSGQFTVAIAESGTGYRYLSVAPTYGTKVFIRAESSSQVMVFA